MPTDYSIADLAQLAHVSPRTIRYYVSQGLLPSPGQVGPGTRYGEGHLARLRLIRALQREHQPLAAIRARLAALGDDDVARLVGPLAAAPRPATSALDYVRAVLGGPAPGAVSSRVAPLKALAPAELATPDAFSFAASETPSAAAEGAQPLAPVRSQWERVAFGPDIEIHVRRPLDPVGVKRLDRLLAFARELFEGDRP